MGTRNVTHSRPTVVLVSGESGIGKTYWGICACAYGEDPRVRTLAFAAPVKALACDMGWYPCNKTAQIRARLWSVSEAMDTPPIAITMDELATMPPYVQVVVMTDHRYPYERTQIEDAGYECHQVHLTEAHRAMPKNVFRAAARDYVLALMGGEIPTWL